MTMAKLISLDAEREFHNQRFKEGDSRDAQQKYYWAIQRGARKYWESVQLYAKDSAVLCYGCGLGQGLADLLPIVKSMDAIDISDVAIGQLSESLGSASARFHVMDAMSLDFADRSFDLVFGSGIIHHLDIERSCKELYRVLKPGGKAVFWEPLGINPIINAYRHLTPSARTRDEHPLLPKDFKTMREIAFDVRVEYFGALTLFSIPFHGRKIGEKLLYAFDKIDSVVLKFPGVRFSAWFSLITLTR